MLGGGSGPQNHVFFLNTLLVFWIAGDLDGRRHVPAAKVNAFIVIKCSRSIQITRTCVQITRRVPKSHAKCKNHTHDAASQNPIGNFLVICVKFS
jgi:hypothetical protein